MKFLNFGLIRCPRRLINLTLFKILGITAERCTKRNCCWDDTAGKGTPWCYQERSIIFIFYFNFEKSSKTYFVESRSRFVLRKFDRIQGAFELSIGVRIIWNIHKCGIIEKTSKREFAQLLEQIWKFGYFDFTKHNAQRKLKKSGQN